LLKKPAELYSTLDVLVHREMAPFGVLGVKDGHPRASEELSPKT